MTWEQRLGAVAAHGFTERQAGFLVTVMLHAGVCLGRHYCAYARIAHGQKMHDFFQRLLDRGHATVRTCGHNTARLYHVHAKSLYEAIGERDNRHRKPTPLARAVERLMLLDAVLAERERTWLATERDKLEYFTLTHPVPRRDLPALVFRAESGDTIRYFPDKLPIAVGRSGQTFLLLYLITRPTPIDFRAFLERQAALLRVLPAWTLRLLVPQHLTDVVEVYQQAFREQLAMPLSDRTLDEVRWYFQAQRATPLIRDARFNRAARAFGAPRFRALYRAWLERGERVLESTLSPVLADTINRQISQLECHVLPRRYLHLLPLVGTA